MTRVTWVCLVVHGCMCTISLYKAIERIRVMALHVGVLNRRGNMVDSTCDYVHGVLGNVSYSDGPRGDICAQLCIYVFRHVWIASYDIEGCNINMVIDPE